MSDSNIDYQIQQLIQRHEVAKTEVEKWDKKIRTVYRLRNFIETVLWGQKHKASLLRITIVADDAPCESMSLDLDEDVRVYVIGELCDFLQKFITRFSSQRNKHYGVECADILSEIRQKIVGEASTDLREVNKQCREEWGR